MKKLAYSLLVFLCLGGPIIAHAQVTPFLSGRLQYTFDSICTKYKIKGASAAVLIPNVGIWKGANGISEEGVPATSDMLFGMGSNTKTHMSAALLKMQEQHLVSLDDTIGKWIQGYENISGKITIRQCLNHTSGLFDYMQNEAINDSIFGKPSKIWTREEILGLALEPNFTPGTSWDYSNTNYIIAGIIIEKVMNKSPYQVVHDLILAPNGLTHTFNFGEQGALTYAHPWTNTIGENDMVDMTTTPFLDNVFSLANTAGSLITTAEDNVQFWHKLTSGQVLSPESWKEMTTFVNIGGSDGYGLGIFLDSRRINLRTVYSHGGTFFGYINENIVDTTSGVTIAVLTNQDSVNNSGLQNLVIKALHKIVLMAPPTGVAETVYNSNTVTVYPNPATDKVQVTIQNADFTGEAVFTDIIGREVYKEAFMGSGTGINTSSLGQGIYIMSLNDQDGYHQFTSRIQIVR